MLPNPSQIVSLSLCTFLFTACQENSDSPSTPPSYAHIIEVDLTGEGCVKCANAIAKSIRAEPGVLSVTVHPAHDDIPHRLHIFTDHNPPSEETLRTAATAAEVDLTLSASRPVESTPQATTK